MVDVVSLALRRLFVSSSGIVGVGLGNMCVYYCGIVTNDDVSMQCVVVCVVGVIVGSIVIVVVGYVVYGVVVAVDCVVGVTRCNCVSADICVDDVGVAATAVVHVMCEYAVC